MRELAHTPSDRRRGRITQYEARPEKESRGEHDEPRNEEDGGYLHYSSTLPSGTEIKARICSDLVGVGVVATVGLLLVIRPAVAVESTLE